MPSSNAQAEAVIIQPDYSFNKKMGNVKFDQVFNSATLTKASKVVEAKNDEFKNASLADYNELVKAFEKVQGENPTADNYQEISMFAFSIKSRAQIGGIPMATEVSRVLYEFCDKLAVKALPGGYQLVKIAVKALGEIFNGNFDTNNQDKCQKLISGLKQIAEKCLK